MGMLYSAYINSGGFIAHGTVIMGETVCSGGTDYLQSMFANGLIGLKAKLVGLLRFDALFLARNGLS